MNKEEKQFNETLNKYANNFTNEDAYLINDYLTTLQQENKQLQEELKYTIGIVEHNRIITRKNKEIHQLKDNWNKLKEYIRKFPAIGYSSLEKVENIRLSGKLLREDYLLNKMQELQGSDE